MTADYYAEIKIGIILFIWNDNVRNEDVVKLQANRGKNCAF